MTPCDTSDLVKKRNVSDKSSAQNVSLVMKDTLLLPKVKAAQKRKRSCILDDMPNNLTSPETIRKLDLKDLEKNKTITRKEGPKQHICQKQIRTSKM